MGIITEEGSFSIGKLDDEIEFFVGLACLVSLKRLSEKILLMEMVNAEGEKFQLTFESNKQVRVSVNKIK